MERPACACVCSGRAVYVIGAVSRRRVSAAADAAPLLERACCQVCVAQPIRMFAAAAPQEFGQRQTRVLEIGLLDAASYRSASRTTFRTAEGPFTKLALWKNGRGDALRPVKVGRLCAKNPFCCCRRLHT